MLMLGCKQLMKDVIRLQYKRWTNDKSEQTIINLIYDAYPKKGGKY